MWFPTSLIVRALAASVALCGGGVGSLGLTGCQTTTVEQTLPEPYYTGDDVQFFPAGPEFQFPNQVRAIEDYQLDGIGGVDGVAAPIGPVN